MTHTRLKRFVHFLAGLFLLAVPLILIANLNTPTATAGVNHFPPLQSQPVIGFSNTSYLQNEGAGTATINVTISQAPVTTATVEYLVVNGSATSPSDYSVSPNPGTLTFTSGGGTTLSFIITINNDTMDEPNETVNLILRNPVNATLSGTNSTAVLTIQDDDPTPTSTPIAGSPTPIYVDIYEPNDILQDAATILVDDDPACDITLWPASDVDYFRFVAKAGKAYEVLTSNLDEGIDTELTVYNTVGNPIATNDDYEFGNRASQVIFSASVYGYYYARVTNKNPGDPANQTYCFEVNEIQGTATPTHVPTLTPVPGADACEDNGDFDTACLIGAGETYTLNFVPAVGQGPDNDYFRLWIKTGIFYTCETLNLSSVNDTNMILYDQNHNGLGGNDDKAPGDFGSLVSYRATYTGWLYILVGPYAPPEYALSYLYTYSLRCLESVPTPTPTGTATRPPTSGGGTGGGTGGSQPPQTPTPLPTSVFPTFPATPTPFEFPTPTATPNVQVMPLPTNTPTGGGGPQQTIQVNVTIYYDSNNNYTPELTEGVEDMAVTFFDNSTGELLAFGYTNEAGVISSGALQVSGPVRVSIPFLGYNQVVTSSANITLRIAPWPAPGNIP
ncbi:MAG: hypothetical protein L0332_00515 [Chloroflexi bacterium]|nr:hypothetical protein [Chloroflexota bacterium]MCI0575996.1 hypothetical protein [Chloroflexota bacterium]MCI0648222.1 hypothetical protein [Chloroflexota bacterium]MCI0725206.1 hypothetical protein [Chloroflexota bacterium]